MSHKLFHVLKVKWSHCSISYYNHNTTLTTNNGKDVFFVWNTIQNGSEYHKRVSDDDIAEKYYFAIDIDIRQAIKDETWNIISQEELYQEIEHIKEKINNDKYMRDRSAIVCSGNWMHIYYTTQKDLNIGKDEYKNYVKYRLEYTDKIEWLWWLYTTDKSCCNLSRIMRLPDTVNTKCKEKYNIDWDVKTVLLDSRTVIFWQDNVLKISERYLQIKEQNTVNYVAKSSISWDSVYEAINNIPIGQLVCDTLWIKMQRDWKNFASPKDGMNMGMFVNKDNLLINNGTHYLDSAIPWYNCFSFVSYYNNLDNKHTFQWFKDKYADIQRIADEDRQEFLRQQEIAEKPEIEDPQEYEISMWDLMAQARDYRRSITKENICSYWIFDKHLQWILPDELVVIAADTGSGKSEISYKIAVENAKKDKKVFLFSLEWSLEEIALREIQREIAKQKSINTVDYRYNWGKHVKDEEDAIRNYSDKVKKNLKVFNKKEKTTLWFIKELITKSKDRFDMFIIDHLHYISFDWQNENKEISDIMRELKMLTDIIKKPVVLVSHLRKRNKKISPIPTIDDLYGSWNIAKEATTILIICRDDSDLMPAMYKKKHISWTRFMLVKSRAWLPLMQFIAPYDISKKDYIDFIVIDKEKSSSSFTFW